MELTDRDFQRAASLLGCEVAAIRAVADVESSGLGFLADGQPQILFEAHVFSRLTDHVYDASNPDISSRSWNKALYKGGVKEHARLKAACDINRDAALQSASWGEFQIMGFNWKRCGYESLQEFINAMYRSPSEHLTAFCRFMQSMGLADELQRKDWAGFARGFNGVSFASNRYDERLASAYESFR